ncbi:MAG: alcohol dehydrogenase catalytic domain-containing protein [Chloroflexi bacterium]|nr:alcohol dehydrogenase catalytic domain-containing protein [Chloroflexota bacterium]
MLAAVWNADRTLAVTDLPEPEPGPGETLIRVEACGICGTDLHFFRGELPPRPGLAPGHEFAGTVVSGGQFAPGTPVAVEPIQVCGACSQCRSGNPQRCAALKFIGLGLPGGLQQMVAVPSGSVYALPDGVDPLHGSLAEPLAVAVRGVHLAELPLGARVLVLGGGTIGLMATLLLRDVAAEVAVTARYAQQASLALSLGASAVFEPGSSDLHDWARERRPDAVIETVGGAADTLNEAIMAVRPGGTVVALGVFTGPTAIPAFKLVNQEVRLVGSIIYGRQGDESEFGIAVRRLARYRADLPLLQSHTFALGDVNDAFSTAANKSSGAVKVTIRPNG